MSNTHRNTLSQHAFFSCNPNQEPLFAVREGGHIDDGLNIAASFLSAADSVAIAAAEGGNEDCMWAAHYLIEMTQAILDAAISAIQQESRHV
jgi:hypothetical protein